MIKFRTKNISFKMNIILFSINTIYCNYPFTRVINFLFRYPSITRRINYFFISYLNFTITIFNNFFLNFSLILFIDFRYNIHFIKA